MVCIHAVEELFCFNETMDMHLDAHNKEQFVALEDQTLQYFVQFIGPVNNTVGLVKSVQMFA